MAGLVALGDGGESVSAPGCLCGGTGTLLRLSLCHDHNPSVFFLKGNILPAVPLNMSIAILGWEKIAVNVFEAARFRRPLTPEQRRN